MLRANYNYNLADRKATYQARFVQGKYCDLRSKSAACPLTCCGSSNSATSDTGEIYKVKKKTGEIKLKTAEEIQITNLPALKQVRPWYKEIDSTVLQQNVKRLQVAYNNFFAGRGKYPKFKNKSNFKSFTFTTGIKVTNKAIYLPKLGWIGYFNSRPIPEGFKVKSATVRLKADGLYVTLKIEDKSVPSFPVIPREEVKTVVGLDMGITKLVHCSDGSQYNNPKHSTNKRTRKLLKVRQRSLSRKKKHSNNRKKARIKVSRLHQKNTHRREAFQWKLARELTKKSDAIVVEDLNNLQQLLTDVQVVGQHRRENVGMVLVLDASFKKLSDLQKSLLLNVSVYRGAFDKVAAAALITGSNDIEIEKQLKTLVKLILFMIVVIS